MKIGRCEFTFDADGKGGSTWWQKALLVLAIPFLLVYLLLDALLEAPGKLGMWFCNTLGRAGLPEIGGALLQLRYPSRRIEWLSEGEDAERLDKFEKLTGFDCSHRRRPHFSVINVIKIKGEKRNGRE
jgi:hypothetical protein